MATSSHRHPLGLDPLERVLLTPGPLGHNDAASPATSPSYCQDTPGPLGINDHAVPEVVNVEKIGTSGRWNPEAAASFLIDPRNGWAGEKSQGRCARAVRQAINAGNVATPNNPVSAADYAAYLPTLGFFEVQLTGYQPEVGDIAVFPAIAGTKLIHGHIEMYTGKEWRSDYIQPLRPIDGCYGAGFFANRKWTEQPFKIFRRRGTT